jgi:hypothetical protein
MKTLGRIVLTVTCVGLFTLAVSLINNKPVEATNPQSVTVANVPLPVQGTVSVGNTAAVSVSNTPNVNVANTPSVNVANSTIPVQGNVAVSNPLDPSNNPVAVLVNATPTKPYFDHCSALNQGYCDLNPVPSGYRLVVQTMSMFANDTNGNGGAYGSIQYTTNGFGRAGMYIPLLNGVGNQAVAIYVDPITQPECQGGTYITACNISGYLVPLQ